MKLTTNQPGLEPLVEAEGIVTERFFTPKSCRPGSPSYIDSAGDISTTVPHGRGGGRLSASRQSEYLSLKASQIFIEAAGLTQSIGLPFTRFVTINWSLAGVQDSEAAKATARFIKLMSDWTRKLGKQILWAWVRENGPSEGSHVHILIACPADIPIGRMWRRWIKGIIGKPYIKGTVLTRTIGRSLQAPITSPALFRQNLFKVSAYCCKGVHPDHQFLLGEQRVKYGGWITGKRSAVCQSLLSQLRRRDAQKAGPY